MEFITAYGLKRKVGVDCSVVPSMTKQSFKDECDVNNIMARFERTGVLDFVNEHEARYGDATALDYQVAMQTVALANSMFEDMPAKLRAEFRNDPAEFLAFIENPANLEKSYEMGLRKRKEAPVAASPALDGPTPVPNVAGTPTPPVGGSGGGL